MNFKIIEYDILTSTNDEAKRLARLGKPEGTVIVAKEQTAGKGRQGNTWLSEKNEGLYFSIILRPKEALDAIKITVTAGVAVAEVLNCQIKWTNDIILNGKKVCGILAESSFTANTKIPEFVILGIGINVNHKTFPIELSKKATSLWIENKKDVQIDKLLYKILSSFSIFYEMIQKGKYNDILDIYRKLCITLGKEIRFLLNGQEQTGRAISIDIDGALVVQSDNTDNKNLITLHSGETSVQLPDGYV